MSTVAVSSRRRPSFKADWPKVLAVAAEIIRATTEEYGVPPDLRTPYYELGSLGLLPYSLGAYKGFSRETAKARRAGWFPPLLDETREIDRPLAFSSPARGLNWLERNTRRDRTESQPYALYIATEKRGLRARIRSWFYEEGIPIIPLGGWASQTLADTVRDEIASDGRPAILVVCSDFDPSGLFIPRDFIHRAGEPFAHIDHVSLTLDQVRELELPENPAPEKDSRLTAFAAETGTTIQVELNALEAIVPGYLRDRLREGVERWWDEDAFAIDRAHEEADRAALAAWIERGRPR